MIEFHGVSKAYKSSKVTAVILKNHTGAFPRGRNIGLLGPNGAGKSTLVRLMAGTEFPDSGTIRRTARISFPLSVGGSANGKLTGRENCRFLARLYGLDTRSVERFVQEFAEIGPYFDMPVQVYSSGMRTRFTFGLSMAVDFECYLVDEALAVGDAAFKARCEAVFEAKRKKATMILVSHSNRMLQKYCDMGAVLSGGQLRLYENLEDAIIEYRRLSSGETDDLE